MGNYTDKELFEAIYEVRDRVIRMEEKLNRTEKLEVEVKELRTEMYEVRRIAENALAKAESNEEKIEEKAIANEKEINAIKANTKWAWGFVITFVVGVVSAYFGLK